MNDKDSNGNHGISVLDQKVERYDNVYYFIRKLYFEPKLDDKGTMVHARS